MFYNKRIRAIFWVTIFSVPFLVHSQPPNNTVAMTEAQLDEIATKVSEKIQQVAGSNQSSVGYGIGRVLPLLADARVLGTLFCGVVVWRHGAYINALYNKFKQSVDTVFEDLDKKRRACNQQTQAQFSVLGQKLSEVNGTFKTLQKNQETFHQQAQGDITTLHNQCNTDYENLDASIKITHEAIREQFEQDMQHYRSTLSSIAGSTNDLQVALQRVEQKIPATFNALENNIENNTAQIIQRLETLENRLDLLKKKTDKAGRFNAGLLCLVQQAASGHKSTFLQQPYNSVFAPKQQLLALEYKKQE